MIFIVERDIYGTLKEGTDLCNSHKDPFYRRTNIKHEKKQGLVTE